jgi:uncharacterized protein (TIGR03435 family)
MSSETRQEPMRMKQTHGVVAVAAAFVLAVVRLSSQTPEPKPSFDVISIKPSPPLGAGGPIRLGGGPQGDRFTMNSATLRMLLQMAFQRAGNTSLAGQMQIIGGPGWMDSERYDIQAKTDCSGGTFSRDRLQLMVQSLLEDRFQLKAHRETRELPIYNLVVTKDGPKIKKAADQITPTLAQTLPNPCEPLTAANTPPPLPPPPGPAFDPKTLPRGAVMMMMGPNGMTMRAMATRFDAIVRLLQNQLGRTIVDRTGLEGLYDFELTFSQEGLNSPFGRGLPLPPPPGGAPAGTPAVTAADPAPSLLSAIQELGLKLEPSKGSVEVLVIDSVEKPTEN